MKKLIYSLSVFLMAFMMASCGDPISKVQSLTEDVEKYGDEWTDESQWDDAMVTLANAMIDFADSDPDEEAYEEFKEAVEDCYSAFYDISEKKAKKARDKASDKFDKNHKDLKKEMDKAEKKLKKMSKKFEDD
jgi:GTPase involved in cell partitioning and DNA repair